MFTDFNYDFSKKAFIRFCEFQVSVALYPYEEASKLCGGSLPDYIPKVMRIGGTLGGSGKLF